MTSLATCLPDSKPVQGSLFTVKLAIALALVALADFLFYDQRIGISVVVFALSVMAGSLGANLGELTQRRVLTAAILLFFALVPAVEELNLLSLLFALVSLGLGIAILTHPKLEGL